VVAPYPSCSCAALEAWWQQKMEIEVEVEIK
jgi:hypothetical protein